MRTGSGFLSVRVERRVGIEREGRSDKWGREPMINDLEWGVGSKLVFNSDVGDEQIGVMMEGCRDGVMIELKCRGWIEMLVRMLWKFNQCLLWVRCRGVPRCPTRRTLRTQILASTAAPVMTLLHKVARLEPYSQTL